MNFWKYLNPLGTTQKFVTKKAFYHIDGNKKNIGELVVLQVTEATVKRIMNGEIEPQLTGKKLEEYKRDLNPELYDEPIKIEPVKIEPVKIEPVKDEPVKVEPVKRGRKKD